VRFSISSAFMDFPDVLALARAADEIGYHGLALSDHVVNLEVLETPYPYTSDGSRRWEPFTPWLDPWVTIGALATVTERLQFFTSVYVLPMRNPLVVAKAVATAAAISDNRVQLGIGTGWCEEEFDLLEQPFARRGRRTDEMLELLHAMWQPGWVEHHGEFYDVPRLEMTPVPTERVPILVGGISEVAMKRAARHDGWLADYITIADAIEARATLERWRAEYGRSGQPFSVVAPLMDAFSADDYRRAEEGGVTDILTMPWAFYTASDAPLDQKLDGLARYYEDIVVPVNDL
jgi:probable F420-dependent oxidoreductase